mmetsp:Transcript_33088/g.61143  ORF Transcript_33088/g.61143 Transcript_33088/m.61143 type:complete len:822 (+) Transcript_33088:71-2536(+)
MQVLDFRLLACLLVAVHVVVLCSAECDANIKSACSVTTAQNLGYRVQREALSDGAQELFDEINDPSSSKGKMSEGFYAAIYDFNNVCVAHGAEPSNVGKSLNEIMKAASIISTPNLGELFQAAAMSGGEWVSYPWKDAHWRRSWVLGFPAEGSKLPIPSPSGLMGSNIVIPDDKNLKLTWDSAFPPPWANPSQKVDPAKAYYVEVGYMEVENQGPTCNAHGGKEGTFESCQHENAYNLVRHAQAELKAATVADDFDSLVAQLSHGPFKIVANFYVSMFAVSTGTCVADGNNASNIGRTLQDILKDGGHRNVEETHAIMKNASQTNHGRWVAHPWIERNVQFMRSGGGVDELANRFSFVVGVTPPQGSVYAVAGGYYLFSGFSDPEHHMLGATFLQEPYCKANSRTGCSVITAQNLVFQAHDELDRTGDAAAVFKRVNTETVFPKKYNNVHHWQGYLQKPIGFYVFAYNASNALLLAQGAIPVAAPPVTPGRTTYAVQRALSMVTHPRLREVFLGIVFIAQGGWVTYQWSNARQQGKPAPRKRTYAMPWRPAGSTGPFEVYFGVGYDDVHPEDVAKPCYANEFATCSEEHSYNLAHIVQTDMISLGTAKITVDKEEISTIEALFKKVTDSSFYKLSTGFYPFVFNFDGTCMAHGSHSGSVGLTLSQMVAMRNIEGVPPDLHDQFKAAAEKGGEWVTYPWKDTPGAESELKTKYSFVLPATHNNIKYYVGVGFQSGTALPWQPSTPAPTQPPMQTQPMRTAEKDDDSDAWVTPVVITASASLVLICFCSCMVLYFKKDRDRMAAKGLKSAGADNPGVMIGTSA